MCCAAWLPSFFPSQYGMLDMTALPAILNKIAIGKGNRIPLAAYRIPQNKKMLRLFTANRVNSPNAAKTG